MPSTPYTEINPQQNIYHSAIDIQNTFENIIGLESKFLRLADRRDVKSVGFAKRIISRWAEYRALPSENVNGNFADVRIFALGQWVDGMFTYEQLNDWYNTTQRIKVGPTKRKTVDKYVKRYADQAS